MMVFWAGSLLMLLAAFLVFRVFVRREYLNKGKLSPLAAVLETLVFALHANMPYLFLPVKWPALPPLPINPVHSWISLGITSLGIILSLGFMGYLGFKVSLGQESNQVRQTGPYRWSRNPQILAYGLIVIGLASLYPSLESAGWVLVYAVIAQLMALTEEEHLKNRFGEAYQTYCDRVPRYFQFSSGANIDHD